MMAITAQLRSPCRNRSIEGDMAICSVGFSVGRMHDRGETLKEDKTDTPQDACGSYGAYDDPNYYPKPNFYAGLDKKISRMDKRVNEDA
jgi:hypothetical protein